MTAFLESAFHCALLFFGTLLLLTLSLCLTDAIVAKVRKLRRVLWAR